jgi:hypothetical protein
MTEANWNHLIDVAGAILQYLLGAIIFAVLGWIGLYVKHRYDLDIAKGLAEKTDQVVVDNKASNTEMKGQVAEIKQAVKDTADVKSGDAVDKVDVVSVSPEAAKTIKDAV